MTEDSKKWLGAGAVAIIIIALILLHKTPHQTSGIDVANQPQQQPDQNQQNGVPLSFVLPVIAGPGPVSVDIPGDTIQYNGAGSSSGCGCNSSSIVPPINSFLQSYLNSLKGFQQDYLDSLLATVPNNQARFILPNMDSINVPATNPPQVG